MTEQTVVVKVELGVERLDVAVAFENQGIDFGQAGIGFHIAGVKLLERIHRLCHRSVRHADAFRQLGSLGVGETCPRIDEDLDDFLRRVFRHCLYVHAAF